MLKAVLFMTLILLFAITAIGEAQSGGGKGMWMSSSELRQLPTSGPAWEQLKKIADQPAGTPNLSDQDDPTNVAILAKALVFARTGIEKYRAEVINALMAAIETENGGRTLSLARELVAYVIAADLVDVVHYDPARESRFRNWLRDVRHENLSGKTLISTHEERPNNWGTHAGASRIAAAIYLNDVADLERAARVFKGWLGDRSSYASFTYGDLSWQADANNPAGINPKGAMKNGHLIDGVLPDDQRRSGGFRWPPPKENYVYEALQGALVQAVLLSRAGYDAWNWQDKALLRAFEWLKNQAVFLPTGDDTWQLPLVDHFYGTHFWNGSPTSPGKNVGWTDWTHGTRNARTDSSENESPRGIQPEHFVLHQNYPNPVSRSVNETTIEYEAEGWISLTIYNLLGQKVRTLFEGMAQPDHHTLLWDCRSDEGNHLVNGIYIYKLSSGNRSIAKRLILAQ